MSDTEYDPRLRAGSAKGVELFKDWLAFGAVGGYLGLGYAYLRFQGRLRPRLPLPALVGSWLLGRLGSLAGEARGELVGVEHAGGHAFLARGPLRTTDTEGLSRLRLFEDGAPLGPSGSDPAEVRERGGGRFVHAGWSRSPSGGLLPQVHTWIAFSASDNSDPRTNGRTYTYVSR